MKAFYCIITSLVFFFNYSKTLTPEELLATLTLEQKIGQLFMVSAAVDEELAKNTVHNKSYRMDKEYIEELITTYQIGGIIYLGKSEPLQQIIRTQHFQHLSTVPLLIGQDLEPGRVGKSRLSDFFDFPSNEILGMHDDETLYHMGSIIGELCTIVGVHINFAPVADVNSNPHNPVINDRSFGDNEKNVAQKSIAFMKGLQDAGVYACAKHFPGHGDTAVDSHLDLPHIPHDKARLHAIELYPFKALMTAGVNAIMTAHLCVPAFESQTDLPSSLSYSIVTDLLQHELGFKGLIITDGLDMRGVTQSLSPGHIELHALLAGNDILLCSPNVPKAIEVIRRALIDGILSEKEVDHHVLKILRAKEELFKHRNPIPSRKKLEQLDHNAIEQFKKKLNQPPQ